MIVRESETRRMREILSQDDVMAVFYATEIECVSAFSRRLREQSMDQSSFDGAIDLLVALLEHWPEILPTHDLRLDAEALLTIHPLKTADALQLAAALLWCEGTPPKESSSPSTTASAKPPTTKVSLCFREKAREERGYPIFCAKTERTRGPPRWWISPPSSSTTTTPSMSRASRTVSTLPGTRPRSPR